LGYLCQCSDSCSDLVVEFAAAADSEAPLAEVSGQSVAHFAQDLAGKVSVDFEAGFGRERQRHQPAVFAIAQISEKTRQKTSGSRGYTCFRCAAGENIGVRSCFTVLVSSSTDTK
jgi:hypothetical protein